ncbi:hypothetical protein TcWFU_001705 [Taenia crassiceps]|uniref:Uncharacterized protein n=1 Tax=Taenia crassiceps TaxID=6207 RepID=A0ABR4QAJ7_9CEST
MTHGASAFLCVSAVIAGDESRLDFEVRKRFVFLRLKRDLGDLLLFDGRLSYWKQVLCNLLSLGFDL